MRIEQAGRAYIEGYLTLSYMSIQCLGLGTSRSPYPHPIVKFKPMLQPSWYVEIGGFQVLLAMLVGATLFSGSECCDL